MVVSAPSRPSLGHPAGAPCVFHGSGSLQFMDSATSRTWNVFLPENLSRQAGKGAGKGTSHEQGTR